MYGIRCTYRLMPRFELNERAEFIKCCEECSKLFGVPVNQLTGRRLDGFVSLDSGPRLLMALLDAYRGRPVVGIPITVASATDCRTHVLLSLTAEIHPVTRRIVRLIGEFDCANGKSHKRR